MPVSTYNLQWLNHNGQRAYPFFETASRLDESGSFRVPDSLLLELYLPVHSGLDVDPARFFVRSVAVFSIGVTISVGYDDGSTPPPVVATAVIPLATHAEYQSYALPGSGDFDDVAGKVVIGSLSDLSTLPPGQYFFTPEAGRLDTDCIRPVLRSVSSIVVVNGADRSERLYGDIELTSGTNTRLTVSTVNGKRRVRIDAIAGEGLNDDCVCDGDATTGPVRTINGIPPTADGDFTVLGSACVDVTAAGNGIKLTNTCADPCCGCKELEAITRDMDQFGGAQTTLNSFLGRLEVQVTAMSTTLLSSKTANKGQDCGGGS